MRIKFLGTSAAEGIPAIFCHCDICEYARNNKSRNIRTRSQALINDDLLIDFGPDTYMHSLRYGINLANIHYCLITHTHEDHLYLEDLRARRSSRANLNPGTLPLNVYGSVGVKKALKALDDGRVTKNGSVIFHELNPMEWNKVGKYQVFPVLAVHNTEAPFVYIVKDNRHTIFYCHDTDIFPEYTWVKLAEEKIKFELVTMDCTEGKKIIDYVGHMNFEKNLIFHDMLKHYELIENNSKIVLNHFSHNGRISYDDSLKFAHDNNFIISYDGLEIEL